jgi:hypothetical protein
VYWDDILSLFGAIYVCVDMVWYAYEGRDACGVGVWCACGVCVWGVRVVCACGVCVWCVRVVCACGVV